MVFILSTEGGSGYRHLSTKEILFHINQGYKKVPDVIEQALPAIEELIEEIKGRMLQDGRLFYVGGAALRSCYNLWYWYAGKKSL